MAAFPGDVGVTGEGQGEAVRQVGAAGDVVVTRVAAGGGVPGIVLLPVGGDGPDPAALVAVVRWVDRVMFKLNPFEPLAEDRADGHEAGAGFAHGPGNFDLVGAEIQEAPGVGMLVDALDFGDPEAGEERDGPEAGFWREFHAAEEQAGFRGGEDEPAGGLGLGAPLGQLHGVVEGVTELDGPSKEGRERRPDGGGRGAAHGEQVGGDLAGRDGEGLAVAEGGGELREDHAMLFECRRAQALGAFGEEELGDAGADGGSIQRAVPVVHVPLESFRERGDVVRAGEPERGLRFVELVRR